MIFLVIAIILEMTFIQVDVISTYLGSTYGLNEHTIYIKISQQYFEDQKRLICKILKSSYKLK